MNIHFNPDQELPKDWQNARFLGRMDLGNGPTPILISQGIVYDMSRIAPTVSALIEQGDFTPSDISLGALQDLNLSAGTDTDAQLLSPIDLQCVKAAGVTFALSAIERVIEERARGNAEKANEIRATLQERIGVSIRNVVPGSPESAKLKAVLIKEDLWSQYLEVAIGPDAEIFTKSPVLSTLGWGSEVGIRSDSDWNNPEPEIVLIVDRAGKTIGATLGNDVNLRDFEGRSALLLGKAKDNNASCSLGPFIRLFDDGFTIETIETETVLLNIQGTDGFTLDGKSLMSEISRPPLEIVRQTLSEHQYPDGFCLFLGTLFAPTQDRDQAGQGFTHKIGDQVHISCPSLGRLSNPVTTSKIADEWQFGIMDLFKNLKSRDLI